MTDLGVEVDMGYDDEDDLNEVPTYVQPNGDTDAVNLINGASANGTTAFNGDLNGQNINGHDGNPDNPDDEFKAPLSVNMT